MTDFSEQKKVPDLQNMVGDEIALVKEMRNPKAGKDSAVMGHHTYLLAYCSENLRMISRLFISSVTSVSAKKLMIC